MGKFIQDVNGVMVALHSVFTEIALYLLKHYFQKMIF